MLQQLLFYFKRRHALSALVLAVLRHPAESRGTVFRVRAICSGDTVAVMLKLAGNELPVTAVLLRGLHRFEQLVMTKDALDKRAFGPFRYASANGEIGELFFATMLKKV